MSEQNFARTEREMSERAVAEASRGFVRMSEIRSLWPHAPLTADTPEYVTELEIRGRRYRVCATCTPNHIDNCRTCFGFGVYATVGTVRGGGPVPVAAGDIELANPPQWWEACPECGSTPAGVAHSR